MSLEQLILQTQEKFPAFSRDSVQIAPLEKGGSDRKFYRICMGSENPLILVKYSIQKEENCHYVAIAQFLDANGINVPRIYFHDPVEGLIWMEDLGEIDLWEHRDKPWPQLRELYRGALDQALLLHSRAHHSPLRTRLQLQKEFNAELYLWEQNYFLENCLERYFKVPADIVDLHRRSTPLQKIAIDLAVLPRVFVHRDFQSQNIMVRAGAAWLIDFQGLRPGLAQYDLASLLYDPYVALTEPQRDELLDNYIAQSIDAGIPVPADFRRIFDLCAMQRLMQALGAYGFLGLVKERLNFLDHIKPALASLKLVLTRIPDLENLRVLLDTLE
jgi:aminoglycoside/choline kinase family phosphotransferase